MNSFSELLYIEISHKHDNSENCIFYNADIKFIEDDAFINKSISCKYFFEFFHVKEKLPLIQWKLEPIFFSCWFWLQK